MQTITNHTADTAEQESWLEWADRESDAQEAIDKRHAEILEAEANVIMGREEQEERYNRWLMQSAFRDVSFLIYAEED
jgi:hypothetical protein